MTESNFDFVFISFFSSLFFLCLLQFTKKFHIKLSLDDSKGPQKIHSEQIMRIGGVIIVPSYFLTTFFFEQNQIFYLKLCLVLIPVLFFGLAEDLFKNVKPYKRLIGTLITAFLIYFFLETALSDFSIIKFKQPILILFLTVLGITTITNAFNIIDGLNGLSLGIAIISLLSIFFVAINIKDTFSADLVIFLVSPLIPIFIFNFPLSKIFIGDGGAYILGCIISLATITISENNNEVNPFFSFLIILYPLYECVRSFVRRLINSKRFDWPDNSHLHSVLYQWFVSKKLQPKAANPIASFTILTSVLILNIWGIRNFDDRNNLILGCIVFIIFYELLIKFSKKELKI